MPDNKDNNQKNEKAGSFTPDLELAPDEDNEAFSPNLELAPDEDNETFKPDLELAPDEDNEAFSPNLELAPDEDVPDTEAPAGPDSDQEEDIPGISPESEPDADAHVDAHDTEAPAGPDEASPSGSQDEHTEDSSPDESPKESSGGTPSDPDESPKESSGDTQANPDVEFFDDEPVSSNKKWLIFPVILILLAAVVAGGIYMYVHTLKKPQETVMNFIKAASELDFKALEDMTQSKDMSILEDTDVTVPVFRDFFIENNRKISSKIVSTRLNLKANTAQVTVHFKYPDNTDVYRQALSELLRQVVEQNPDLDISADTEMQETILSLLKEKSSELDDSYVETDVVYNLIKVNGEWKIVALDRETIRVISANCISLDQEIDRLQSGDDTVLDNRYLEEDESFNLDTEDFSIKYANHEVSKDFAGAPCLLLYYDYTNKSEYSAGALIDVSLTVYQHGKKCPQAIPADNKNKTSSYLKEVGPGETLRICQAFKLIDLADVTVQVSRGVKFKDENARSVVIRLE